MISGQALDPLPIGAIFVLFVAVSLAVFEVGFRIGRWWQERTPDEKEGATGMLVGSLLAMLAFLLAVTMSMASSRFDTRRDLVLQEADAIGTTFLRAGYLPEPYRSDIRDRLRAYVPLRIRTADTDQLAADNVRSIEIQGALWAQAEELARRAPESDVLAIFIESLNDMIDLSNDRWVAGVYARVPETVVILLVVGGALTLGMVGYNAGLHRRRSFASALVLVLVIGAVVTLIIDLDRPRDGFLTVSQQALVDLQQQLGDPAR
jgi:membrane protein YdbS with pleckstrin-like domain